MKIIYILFFSLLFFGCSKDIKDELIIKENSQELEMISSYNEAYKALNDGDYFFASKKFLEAELLYPQSSWAPKAALMASYAFYMQNFYSEAVNNLERFFKTYPNNDNAQYAHYLEAICYYELIEDEKRDSAPLLNAKKKFNFIIINYPNSEFAIDSKFKIDLIQDILASKEMYLGRHYIKKKKWIAALNRFLIVVNDYNTTIFIEEALHRLVEIYYKLGLIDESQKYANILGYNYLSSEWYKKSYKIFNSNYSINDMKKSKKDKNNIINRFKKLF